MSESRKIYNAFMTEVGLFRNELDNLDNVVPIPFAELFRLLEIDVLDVDELSAFHKWRTDMTSEFYNIVRSRGLYVHEDVGYWYILPFNPQELPYDYKLDDVDALVDILTNGELRLEYGDIYDIYDFDEYLYEICDTEQEVIDTFTRGLEHIERIREERLKFVERVCDELRDQFSVNALLSDCERYVFETEE